MCSISIFLICFLVSAPSLPSLQMCLLTALNLDRMPSLRQWDSIQSRSPMLLSRYQLDTKLNLFPATACVMAAWRYSNCLSWPPWSLFLFSYLFRVCFQDARRRILAVSVELNIVVEDEAAAKQVSRKAATTDLSSVTKVAGLPPSEISGLQVCVAPHGTDCASLVPCIHKPKRAFAVLLSCRTCQNFI